MTIDTLKNTVASFLPIGTKIRRTKHIDANNAIIDGLYYSEWGIPKPYLGSVLPDGWVWCNTLGQTVNASDCNPEFVTRMGSSYGGDGINTIGIPYISGGMSLVQAGDVIIGPTTTTLEVGDVGGETGVTLDITETPAHTHYMFSEGNTRIGDIRDNANRNKTIAREATSTSDGNNDYLMYVNNDQATRGKTSTVGGLTGITMPHNNMSPYFVVNFILRYK